MTTQDHLRTNKHWCAMAADDEHHATDWVETLLFGGSSWEESSEAYREHLV